LNNDKRLLERRTIMLQLVAGLTVVFAGYVLYEVFKTVSGSSNQPPTAGNANQLATPKGKSAAKLEARPPAKPEPTPAADVTAEPVKAETPAMSPVPAGVSVADEKVVSVFRNPTSGETCAVPTNYRFAKKWVKEALVAEGLLDKIYKNADLDDEGSRIVKEALDGFKAIEKYHG
jgi:hypothetical protein